MYTPLTPTPSPLAAPTPPPSTSTPQVNTPPAPAPVTADTFIPRTVAAPKAITPSNLATATPVTVPPANPIPSPYQGALAATTSSYMTPPPNATISGDGTATNTPPPAQDNTYQDVLKSILEGDKTLGTKGDVTNQLNSDLGVNQKQQDYITAYNQYNSKKLAYQQEIDNIYNQPGITREAAQAQASELSRVHNADLANLAVITQAAQGNFQGALDIVKRKIDAQFDPIQAKVDNLGKYIQLNNANLTDSQKTELENKRFQLQNNLDQLKTAKLSAHQFALQQGITDPSILNAIDAAQTPTDAYAAIGGNPNNQNGQGGSTPVVNQQYASYQSSTSDGVKYVSQDKLTNLTPYQQQEAARQYAAAGVAVLPTDKAAKIDSIEVTKGNLTDMSSILLGTKNADGTTTGGLLGSGVIGRIGSAAKNIYGQVTQSNPDVAAFNNYRTIAINALQALGAGSGGARITASEIATATSNLPTITDNAETAQSKLNIVNGFLSKWQHQLLPASGGDSGNATGQTVQTKAGAVNTNW